MGETLRHPVLVALVAATLVLMLVPAGTAAQADSGGTFVVEEGETVSEVSGVAGTVIVRGTVTGDVSTLSGNVHVAESGTVEGDLSAAAGNVRISGTVAGTVAAGAGNVRIDESGSVGGDFDVGAGNVIVEGAIEGDATVGAETIRLGEGATIAGSLTYDGALEGNVDAVQGDVTRDSSLGVDLVTDLQPVASWVFTAYAFVLNLVLGGILLFLFPEFSRGVADRVVSSPGRTGLVGIVTVVGILLALFVLVLTVVGIPLALVGLFTFALLVWIGIVYGRFAVGAWLLSLANVDNRWIALVVGLLLGAILTLIPIVGGILNLVIFFLGIGALSHGLYAHQRRSRPAPASPPERSPGD